MKWIQGCVFIFAEREREKGESWTKRKILNWSNPFYPFRLEVSLLSLHVFNLLFALSRSLKEILPLGENPKNLRGVPKASPKSWASQKHFTTEFKDAAPKAGSPGQVKRPNKIQGISTAEKKKLVETSVVPWGGVGWGHAQFHLLGSPVYVLSQEENTKFQGLKYCCSRQAKNLRTLNTSFIKASREDKWLRGRDPFRWLPSPDPYF